MKRLIFACALALLAAGCSRKGNAEVEAASRPAPPPEVRVAAAETRQIERAMSVTGSLLPDESVNVSFEVPGNVQKIYVDFGQSVRKGQIIAELDKRELTWALERSRAALAQALARIGLKPGDEEANPDTTPAIRQVLAQVEDARFKFESAQRLVKSGDISQERFTELEKTYHQREAALQAARDDLRTQLAALQGLRAEVKLADKRLSDAVLRAPFEGAITARMVSPGQYLKENTPVLTLVKTNPLRLRAEIPEAAVGDVRIGTTLAFLTDAAPGATFQAVVRELNPALDPRSRSLTAEARLTQSDARLKPGMFVQVRLVVARNAQVVVAPKEALYNVAGLTKVFVIRDGVALERKVQPGQQIGDWVEIPSLQPGDRVAVSNLGQLVDGGKVQVKS